MVVHGGTVDTSQGNHGVNLVGSQEEATGREKCAVGDGRGEIRGRVVGTRR